ncbi:MAG: hypothetical protein D6785_01930, partial [Planctomycetota bacterium]
LSIQYYLQSLLNFAHQTLIQAFSLNPGEFVIQNLPSPAEGGKVLLILSVLLYFASLALFQRMEIVGESFEKG